MEVREDTWARFEKTENLMAKLQKIVRETRGLDLRKPKVLMAKTQNKQD